MDGPYPFAGILTRLRREQGFKNAHSFYKGSGGAKMLGLSYVNYLALERGRSLPKVNRLEAISRALNLMPGSAQRKELVRSYISSLLGGDSLLREIDAAPSGQAKGEQSLVEETVRQAQRQRGVHMTPAQWELLAKDEIAYLCDLYMENTPGYTNIEDIARAIGVPLAKVTRAIKVLAAAGLAETSGGRARSPLAYKMVYFPPITPETSGIVASWLERRRSFLSRSKVLQDWCTVARISSDNLNRLTQLLRESVHLMGIYGDSEKAADTRIYAAETRLFEVFE